MRRSKGGRRRMSRIGCFASAKSRTQEKRLVAQVNAVAVLDMIKDLQEEIKVARRLFGFIFCFRTLIKKLMLKMIKWRS